MHISNIRLFHLTYWEIATEYAEALFSNVSLRPAKFFFGVSVRPTVDDFWSYIAIFKAYYTPMRQLTRAPCARAQRDRTEQKFVYF